MKQLIRQNSDDKWPKRPQESILTQFLMKNDTFLTKELIGPLEGNKAVNLTRQIKQSLLSPKADVPKPKIFNKWKDGKRNIRSLKLSQRFEQPLPLG